MEKQNKEKKVKVLKYTEKGGIKNLPHNLKVDFLRNKGCYLLILPVVIWFIVMHYLPMGGLVMAFEKFSPGKGIFGSKWVGFDNFKRFFTGIYFWRLIKNTAVLGLLDLVISFPAPIIFALLLNEIKHRFFKKTVQTISYMPYFVSTVIMCGLIIDFVQGGGVISNILAKFNGGVSQNLLANGNNFRIIFVLSTLWQNLGYGSIIYIAALSGVDQELYDAAVVDGAGRWKQTLHITIPAITPTIVVMLILKMSTLLNVSADKVLLLYSPGIYDKADVISSYVYRTGILEYNYSFSTAVGLFNSVIATVLLLASNAICRKFSESSLF